MEEKRRITDDPSYISNAERQRLREQWELEGRVKAHQESLAQFTVAMREMGGHLDKLRESQPADVANAVRALGVPTGLTLKQQELLPVMVDAYLAGKNANHAAEKMSDKKWVRWTVTIGLVISALALIVSVLFGAGVLRSAG